MTSARKLANAVIDYCVGCEESHFLIMRQTAREILSAPDPQPSATEEKEEPRCPKCGYSRADQELHGDHYLCSGKIPDKS